MEIARVYIRVSSVGNRGDTVLCGVCGERSKVPQSATAADTFTCPHCQSVIDPKVGMARTGVEFLSPDIQMEAGRSLAKMRGWHLDEEASLKNMDLDVSGRKEWKKRPGLSAHIADARDGAYQHFIVYKLSRLARSARNGLDIFDVFDRAKIPVHIVKEGIDSDTPMGRLIRTVLLAVAEMQSEDTAQFVRDAIINRVSKGKHHGNLPGWIMRGEDGSYLLNEPIADMYRNLAFLRTEGRSLTKVAREANSKGWKTVTGLTWTARNLSRVFTSEAIRTMRGISILGTDYEDGDPRKIQTPDVLPRLLTDEQADALETVCRAAPNFASNPIPRNVGRIYLLSDMMYCAYCRYPMHLHFAKKQEISVPLYFCEQSKNDEAHPKGFRGGMMFQCVNTENAVLLAFSFHLADLHSRGLLTEEEPRNVPEASADNALTVSLVDINGRIERLMSRLDKGLIEEEDFKPMYQALVKERQQINVAIARQYDANEGAVARRAALSFLDWTKGGEWGEAQWETLMQEGMDALTRTGLRSALRRYIHRAEGPVIHSGVRVAPRGTQETRWVRVFLKTPLATGENVLDAPIIGKKFKGMPPLRAEFAEMLPTNHKAQVYYPKK